MKTRALRGVCIGVDRHMKPGDIEDLEPALVTYLVGIGAVEIVPEKPAINPVNEPELALMASDETEQKQTPEKSSKKEK